MGIHPNVILMSILTPDDLSRKTMRSILADNPGRWESEDDVDIDGDSYHVIVMESDYEDSFQISANEGDIVVFDLVTYGYGEFISWDDLEEKKSRLEEWSQRICEKHHCSYSIRVSANYW